MLPLYLSLQLYRILRRLVAINYWRRSLRLAVFEAAEPCCKIWNESTHQVENESVAITTCSGRSLRISNPYAVSSVAMEDGASSVAAASNALSII